MDGHRDETVFYVEVEESDWNGNGNGEGNVRISFCHTYSPLSRNLSANMVNNNES